MRDILVVTVPAGTIKPDGFGAFREYIIESILRDVLVLDENMKMSMESVPALEVPKVMLDISVEEGKQSKEVTPKEEKRLILERLTAYREKHGLGSLNLVAEKMKRKGVTGDTLRMVLLGDAKLEIADWRAIGKALDKLEG